ncbi:hypothetical protein POTOM_005840 [Populus tomentosa]|uniref:RING-type domain-containing protein n=1 Tax=Populus tomentosa TaxID=118781 RepID=A0A8X8AMT0_POPTO|nr:hypothetical protein POTOM_005840 [Populus tomentosa]
MVVCKCRKVLSLSLSLTFIELFLINRLIDRDLYLDLLPSYIVSCTKFPFVGNVSAFQSIKSVWTIDLCLFVRTYSEWVIDGEYDWPPKCCSCQGVLEEGDGPQTTRLGCLHVIHTNCLVSHIKSFPPHTAPAGYVCPSCSTPIWPPKNVKDSGSRFHSKLKEAIMQTGLEKNLFGNHPVSLLAPPPTFTSDPLVAISSSSLVTKDETGTVSSKISVSDIVEIDSPNSAGNYMKNSSPGIPGAATRKVGVHVERQNSELSYYADDEDGNHKKYSRRGDSLEVLKLETQPYSANLDSLSLICFNSFHPGSFRHKFLRALLPFWSSALPILPVTAPPRKDASNADDPSEGRTRQKRSRTDPRKILLFIAIMACMATMGILYYRIAQRGFGEEQPGDEQQ